MQPVSGLVTNHLHNHQAVFTSRYVSV